MFLSPSFSSWTIFYKSRYCQPIIACSLSRNAVGFTFPKLKGILHNIFLLMISIQGKQRTYFSFANPEQAGAATARVIQTPPSKHRLSVKTQAQIEIL